MTARLLHTSDWQIGKAFRFVDDGTMGLLQEARLQAIARLGDLALEHDVKHVLVAGDVYDMEAPSPRTLNQPIERMRTFAGVQWHLLPGNHDPHRPNGLWEQLLRRGVPDNVRVHVTPGPVILEHGSLVLLPAPLQHRRTLQDPTSYMDGAEVPGTAICVGLAHGTVVGFGSNDEVTPNRIAPDRPARAGLSYLALGDWHGQKKINDRCWYSGTPEIDAFDVEGGGHTLLVEIEAARAIPKVTPLNVGQYAWVSRLEQIASREDVDFLEGQLRGLEVGLERVLVHLTVEGALSLEDRRYFEERIVEGLSAAFCFVRVDGRQLFPRPTVEDLDQIDRGGFVRAAAEVLKQRADDNADSERDIAAEALQRLYIEHMKGQADQR